MKRHNRIRSVVLLSCLAVAASGCQRDKPVQPPAEVQSQSAQPSNQPTTVTGCLKAGEAPDTFVVTAAKSEGSGETATYQLVSNEAGVKLTDHIGRQVEVSGVVRQSQELSSRSRAEQPAGTSGGASKPVVETRTEVDIKRLEVSTVKPLGERCD